MLKISIFFTSTFLIAQSAISQTGRSQSFPTEAWPRSSLQAQGIERGAFQRLRNYVFDPKEKHKTNAFVVIRNGKLIYEEYANGYGPNRRHMLWSFSKGLVNGLIGVAEQKGILSRETFVHEYYPELANTRAGRALQVKHLMQMTSGLAYYEEHPASIILSDSISINYTVSSYLDMASSMAARNFNHWPGTKFNYSSGDANLAMGVLKKALAKDGRFNPDSFPWISLFDVIGMRSSTLEQDAAGTFLGGSFGWSTAQDIAKFAYLYLTDGKWNGDRLFPEGWVEWSLTTSPPLTQPGLVQSQEMRLNQEDYGAYWWLNKKLPMNKDKPFPAAPSDMFLAMGFKGQTLAVIPSKNTIIVRLGHDGLDSDTKIDRAKMIALYMESLKPVDEQSPSPAGSIGKVEAYELRGILGSMTTLAGLINLNTRLDDGVVMAPAKDLCSCIFVTETPQEKCLAEHEQYQLFRNLGLFNGWIRPVAVDLQNKTVTAENRHHLTTASWISPELGCKITRFRHKFWGIERIP